MLIAALACMLTACAPAQVGGWWALRADCGPGSLELRQQGARVEGTLTICNVETRVEGVVRSNEIYLRSDDKDEWIFAVAGRYASASEIEAWLDAPPVGDDNYSGVSLFDDDEAVARRDTR